MARPSKGFDHVQVVPVVPKPALQAQESLEDRVKPSVEDPDLTVDPDFADPHEAPAVVHAVERNLFRTVVLGEPAPKAG